MKPISTSKILKRIFENYLNNDGEICRLKISVKNLIVSPLKTRKELLIVVGTVLVGK